MNSLKLKHLLKGIIYLDIINLENKLSAVDRNEMFFNNDYFIDLSQVRFAELSAITQLSLIIETFLKKDYNVYIALPTVSLTEKEITSKSYSEEQKLRYLNQRKKVNNFLKTTGFVNAIREISRIYKKEILITEDYNFEKEFEIEAFKDAFSVIFQTKSIEYNNYKFIYPLEWIDCNKGVEDFSIVANKIDTILGNPERGLDSLDVDGIKNVILSELIKNVNEHSDTNYALLSIGLIKSISLFGDHKNKKENPIEAEYIKWVEKDNVETQVEIYFGDTGKGVLTKEFEAKYLEENLSKTKLDQLEWAYKKWSTRKNDEIRRGTKGLYRIQRVVNKYNGLFHIRTEKLDGGFQKGGLIEEEWICRKSEYSFEGTFIQIKMCPFSEARKFRFTLVKNKKKKWKTVQYNPKLNADFIDNFKKDIRNSENLLVILYLKDLIDLDAINIVEKYLPEFSYESHPCPVVLYILSNLKNVTIQTLTESANAAITKKTGDSVLQEFVGKDAEEVYDPVLVIGDDNNVFWYGGNQNLIDLLNESSKNRATEVKLSKLNTYVNLPHDIKSRIRLHLETDTKLVNVDNEEELTFNFTNLNTFFKNEITKKIRETSSKKDYKYCTPKLEITENWLDVKDLLKNNEYGYALTLYLKFKKYAESQKKEGINIFNNTIKERNEDTEKECYILIDHKQQKELAKSFATLYGIKHKNIKNVSEDINPNVPRRTKLFKEESNVIVLTTIISSSETIRRLVKYVKRDSAFPISVLCICNYRRYDISNVETWDEKTNIISVYQKNQKEAIRHDKNNDYFKSKSKSLNIPLRYKSPEFSDEKRIGPNDYNIEIDSDLRSHLVSIKALHYNHIGIYKDRHFTFYLEKVKILKIKSIIWSKFEDSINFWKNNNNIKNFIIYVPKTLINEKRNINPFYYFLKTLSNDVIIFDELPNIINQQNIVFIDFGIISGKSINKLITKCSQVENLFVCLLFDQSKNNEFNFYKRINTLNNELIFEETVPTKFEISYLYKLSLGYFTSENCPICDHITALEKYKLHQEYMFKFSEDRQDRLKLIDSEELSNSEFPYDFYYSIKTQDHELSSELILKMFELKSLLEKAKFNTQIRIMVFQYIYEIYNNIETYINVSDSRLYALIYYLSHEVNWLQKEPLIFRDLRLMIAEIAYKISVINIAELSKKLASTNICTTTPEKLSIRYKYSAISLLRSTNKLLFCESISEILISAFDGKILSDNLTQNTFYHTISLFQNKYNKSKKYFEAIENQLKLFRNTNPILSILQKVTLEKIENINKQTFKKLEIQSIKTDSELIKLLKKEKEYHYDSQHHPQPESALGNIKLNNFSTPGLLDIKVNKEDSPFYTLFKQKISNIINDWRSVSYFIESTILPYTMKFSDKLVNSYTFRSVYFLDEVLSIIRNNKKNGLLEEFSLIVNKIALDPLYYFSINQKYDHLHGIIFSKIIKEESRLFDFLVQFPTNLMEIIGVKFEKPFPLIDISNKCDNMLVFYPRIRLLQDFQLIIDNIHRRLNEDKKSLKYDEGIYDKIDFKIKIWTEDNFIVLEVSYDSTDKKNEANPRQGGLTDIKEELMKFGGDCDFDTKTKHDGWFYITLKYLKYE